MVSVAPVAPMPLTARVGAFGVTEADSSDAAPAPWTFEARTLNL